MAEKEKIPKPLEAFLIILGGFVVTILASQAFILLLSPQADKAVQSSFVFKSLIILGELGLGLVPFFYLKLKRYPVKELFRWNPIPSQIFWISLPLGISLGIVGDELDRLISLIIPSPEILNELTSSMKVHSGSELIMMVLGVVIIAAVAEESIIRGMLQISMEKHHNVTRAVIYSSLAWTFIHGIIYWALQIFLLGVVLGYLAWRTNSIWPSVICHAVNNGLALLFYNVNVTESLSVYEWKGHVSPLFFVPALVTLFYTLRYLDSYYRAFSISSSSNGDRE